MFHLTCPHCNEALTSDGKSYVCPNRHSFDIAKKGYVNLLPPRHGGGNHGDDKAMIASRRAFLSGGHYVPLLDQLCCVSAEFCGETVRLLDVGCGEGYYTLGVLHHLKQAGKTCSACGVDISKEALMAFGRHDGVQLAVASCSKLPVAAESTDLLLNLFAPLDESEFHRVLKTGGALIRVCPLEDHLMGLKKRVYETPYYNDAPAMLSNELFSHERRIEVRYTLELSSNQEVQDLFSMTPYAHKTAPADREKLNAIETLSTPVSFAIDVFKKQ